jgi:uncharacterized DUF497 family protein
VLRGTVGHNREKIIGGWEKLHKDMFIYTCASTNGIRVIKWRSMRRDRQTDMQYIMEFKKYTHLSCQTTVW